VDTYIAFPSYALAKALYEDPDMHDEAVARCEAAYRGDADVTYATDSNDRTIIGLK
jgi:hypothetical protein